jgi:hypothetical protein
MANRYGFLLNTVPGGTVINASAEFDVRGYAVRLVAGGLIDGDVVQVQVLAGNNDNNVTQGTWADLAYNGTSIQLTDTNTQFVLVVEGRYRVTYDGASTQLQLWMEEDIIGLDQRSIAMFPTANNAGSPGATGPTGPAGPSGVLVGPGHATIATTGVTSNVGGDGISHDSFDASDTITDTTLHLLDATIGGSIEYVKYLKAVTTLTVTGNINADATRIVLAAPTAATANQEFKFVWDDSATPPTWVRFT